MVWETVGSVVVHKPDSEADVPESIRQRRPSVKLLAVYLLMPTVRIACLAERDDAPGELLRVRIVLVLHKARPPLSLAKSLPGPLPSTWFGYVEDEEALHRQRILAV
jgi:hypothetical protein